MQSPLFLFIYVKSILIFFLSLLARQPPVGLGLLIHEVCFFLDHTQRHTTVGRTPLDE